MGVTDVGDDNSQNTSSLSKPASPIVGPQQSQEKLSTVHLEEEDASPDFETDADAESKPQAPTQKRRRVTRACDECRRKKIKCDGKQPCTHCTVYSYDCTYDQPSNRRRNPAPQYIESLEQRLQKAEAIIRAALPGVDLDDPKYDARGIDQILEASKAATATAKKQYRRPEDDAQMRSMVDRTGSLDLDDTGYYDYHGISSGYSFMRKFRAQFGDDFLPIPRRLENKNFANVHGSPKSFYSSPVETGMSLSNDLPPKDVAIELCRNAIDDCCALQRPLHRPTFFRRLHAVYNTDPDSYTNEDVKFLPSLYSAMAIGCLFGRTDENDRNEPNEKGYMHATEQGYQYFNVSKSMLDITDCRDILSLQAVMFMILFLQGTAKLATCYSYIGVALRGCCRLGMHRKIVGKFNVIEQEERKRLFWQVRKMDIYVGAMLGLPQMLSTDDIDQDLPSEVYDEHITEDSIRPVPHEAFSLMRATNAHTKLLGILRKVVRYVYPVKSQSDQSTTEGMISHSLIRELERDLQDWMDELPMQLRPSENSDIELSRVQQLLRMSYAYVQMMIYRPFLHYVSQSCQSAKTDKRSFACAAACVSVARNVVHITSEMKRRGLLTGAYWFVMYTTYFAILSLLYFVLENPESSTSKDILKDAIEGRDTLANLATRSMAADRCTASLSGLFEALPEKLNERRNSIRTATMPSTAKKRPPPTNDPPIFGLPSSSAQFVPVSMNTPQSINATPLRPHVEPRSIMSRTSVPDHAPYPFTPATTLQNAPTPAETMGYSTPQVASPMPLDFGPSAIMQGHLPDLRSVMFPGDNPFAYPNQPISTLDTMPNLPIGIETPPAGDQIHSSANIGTPEAFQRFDDRPLYPERHLQPQFFGMNNFAEEPGRMNSPMPNTNNLQVPGQGNQEDYWSHAPARGRFRTGLTPGGQGVNLDLDDIFGQSQNWNMNLIMSDRQHQQGGMPWPADGQSWQ
ncbi:Gypsy retrotransposon integrase-like protein 1 [Lithohypha guttulata]|uniref:Gypsy retrotransposon integrase-like protein 1 n=1 Tax=Lithohypha guttulata TaxID=1690604 RepID=A0AAN7Y8J5_9EURO|nr:Gypsy retrotransposon integrase-like protein 1 [Lithohypha guttulata]